MYDFYGKSINFIHLLFSKNIPYWINYVVTINFSIQLKF